MRKWPALLAGAIVGAAFGAFLPINSPRAVQPAPFLWGVLAHDDWPASGPTFVYNLFPIASQIPLLQASGLNALRTNCTSTNCPAIITAAENAGVTLLGGTSIMPDGTLTEAQNYSAAYSKALAFAQAFQAIQYYGVGNEVDNWVGPTGDGSSISQYNAAKYAQARGMIRGAIDGYHAGHPGSLTLVDDAGWCHYGFKQALWADGVRWDITAFHWYSDQGNIELAGCENANVAQIQASFGLPVWITEYNSSTAATNNDSVAEGAYIGQFIAQIASVAAKYNIQAAFTYELFDEVNLTGEQAHFGIADGTATMKPAVATAFAAPRVMTPASSCTCGG